MPRLADIRPEPRLLSRQARVYAIKSNSRPGLEHYVLSFHDTVICSCEGFMYSRQCWHVDKVRELENG